MKWRSVWGDEEAVNFLTLTHEEELDTGLSLLLLHQLFISMKQLLTFTYVVDGNTLICIFLCRFSEKEFKFALHLDVNLSTDSLV